MSISIEDMHLYMQTGNQIGLVVLVITILCKLSPFVGFVNEQGGEYGNFIKNLYGGSDSVLISWL
jgi:hypothetical protein